MTGLIKDSLDPRGSHATMGAFSLCENREVATKNHGVIPLVTGLIRVNCSPVSDLGARAMLQPA